MASRFGHSTLHQRDSRSALFEGYSGTDSTRRQASASGSPSPALGGYGYNGGGSSSSQHLGVENRGFRPATPNSRGQYSDAVLSELESQNDQQVEGILGKVKVLKEVGFYQFPVYLALPYPTLHYVRSDGFRMTVAIGDEIRDSTALAEKMNDTFDSTRLRLRGTMNRMLLMAERTGVGWKVWLAFFAAVIFIFCYVWLF
ncbi:hypothetical protein EKO27_g2869 [Xylaria grammica]|uniref:t-SNARE coiled-coil homology domain-containing protein n=1 Tax=Xylaria grammica TaxID=363999 RepID=A0A439DCW7_9PEZI|nr:hypothetical protein EKO27_g2869 [Xylaria grammica]